MLKNAVIAVAIATAGRRDVLADTIDHLRRQERLPDELLVCPASPDDVDADRLSLAFPEARIVTGRRGLPAQRNALIEASGADVMVFIDDDFLLAPDFLIEVGRLFRERPDVVVATGHVLADGIMSAGLEFDEGASIVAAAGPNAGGEPADTYNAYGCNMIVWLEPVRRHGIRFDEVLPLYAWQEDVDFSRQLAPFGAIVLAPRLRGVHLGTKRSGRSPGRRLGYSQVANPIYLWRKGTLSSRHAFGQVARNLAANVTKSARPEPWVDRRGRLRGNVLGLVHLVTRRLSPSKATDL
ncbi:hypothetical protein ASG43_07080 [Aureimonas sp. Leaf454]|uniref:glycosyltransferase family 2 protein n=1 Tax=Aureimonas sp. Leaf454 TaxID=1736381 RepID=UPI000700A025|nr:glycosyltransferase [Aureimonas sp. Leaf454]KQT50999.1 hypothetical protein ASG43_07080 [Aureimonas sp. Leaf454]